jgi:hypothetical protein
MTTLVFLLPQKLLVVLRWLYSRLKLVHISFWTYLLPVVCRVKTTVPLMESELHTGRNLSSSICDYYSRV